MIKTYLTKVAKRSIHRNKKAFCMKEKGLIPIILKELFALKKIIYEKATLFFSNFVAF